MSLLLLGADAEQRLTYKDGKGRLCVGGGLDSAFFLTILTKSAGSDNEIIVFSFVTILSTTRYPFLVAFYYPTFVSFEA
jgi:hypothetical protein